MRLIEVPCPVCSAEDYEVVFPDTLGANPPTFGYKWVPEIRKMYRTVRCRQCTHVYCSPRLADMYKHYVDVIDECYLSNDHLRRETAKRVLEMIRKFVPAGRLIDIGCSSGDFLTVARDHYDVEGLELSTWASLIAKNKGLAIHVQTLEELAPARAAYYDVATMWGVIEHLEHPSTELRYTNRILRTGGIVCLWTGDVDSLYARLMGQRWWYILGQHIQLFNWKSMDRVMRDNGFERVYKGVYPYVISFKYLGISLSRYRGIGALAKTAFRLLRLDERCFVLKKSDEMFAIYRKVRDV